MKEEYKFPYKIVLYTFLLLAALLIFSFFFDRCFIKAVNSIWCGPLVKRFFALLEYPGNFLFLSAVFAVVLLGILWKRFKRLRVIAMVAIASYILTVYSVGIIKGNIHRPRPFEQMYNLDLCRLTSAQSTADSFPSGHTAGAFALLFPFILYSRRLRSRALLFVLGALMAYSRVYLGAHFLSDVVVGAALGAGIATLCYRLFVKGDAELRMPFPEISVWVIIFLFAAVIMHRPLMLVHPVTGEGFGSGYALHYPFIRLFFEPYLGLVAYFNLSGYITVQQLSWFIWGCTISFAVLSRKRGFKECGLRRKAAILIAVAVSIILLQLSFFSGRLPAYKLVSSRKGDFIADLHTHTNASYSWQWGPKAMIYQHIRSGFQGSFLTDYNTVRNFSAGQKIIEEEKLDFMLMPGQEYRGAKIHLLFLGLEEDIPAGRYSPQEAIYRTHMLGGVVIVPHYWAITYRNYSLRDLMDMGVDGFEIANRSKLRSPHQKKLAKDIYGLSVSKGLLMVGGTDNHGLRSATYVWNIFALDGEGGGSNKEQLMDILRGRKQDRIKVITLDGGKEYHGLLRPLIDPLFSSFYYFRSLNLLQWFSWTGWAVIIYLLVNISRILRRSKRR
ncbi:MAG: phosphatase PAP2 family protein [Candidatus Omnitrophota bacterium]